MSKRKHAVEMSLVLANQLISGFGSLILLKLISHNLSPVLYGYYALMTSVVALLAALPFNALNQAVLRFSSTCKDEEERNKHIVSFLFLYGIFIFLYFFLTILIYPFLSDPIWKKTIWIIYLYFLSQIFYTLVVYICTAMRLRARALFLASMAILLNVSLLIIGFRYFELQQMDWIFGLLCVGFFLSPFAAIGQRYKLLLQVHWKFDLSFIRELFEFSFPLVVMSGFIWFRTMASRWYLDFFVDKTAVAIFAILGTLAMMIPTAFQSFFFSYFSPIFYKLYEANPKEAMKKLNRIMVIVILFFLISLGVAAVFGRFLVELFSNSYYAHYSWMLVWMYGAFSLYIVSSMYVVLKAFAGKKTKKLMAPNIILDVLALCTGIIMAKEFGLIGGFLNFVVMYALLGCVLLIMLGRN